MANGKTSPFVGDPVRIKRYDEDLAGKWVSANVTHLLSKQFGYRTLKGDVQDIMLVASTDWEYI